MKKRRNFILFYIIIILIIIIGFILFNFENIKNYFTSEELRLSSQDKEYLLNLAYNNINLYVREGKEHLPKKDVRSKLMKYNNEVTVSIRVNNVVRASKLGSGQDLLNNIINASIRASDDQRFGGPIRQEELNRLKIIISILKDEVLIEEKSIVNIKSNFKLGEDGIKFITLDGKSAYFTPSVPIDNGWGYVAILTNLCLKLKQYYPIIQRLGRDCWKDPAIEIYKLEMIEFEKDFST